MSSSGAPKIKVTCAACGAAYSVKAELAGRSAKCACGAQLTIPALTKTPPAGATTSGDAASQSTIVTAISASSKDTVASKKPAPAKPKIGPPLPQPPRSVANEPVAKTPADEFDDEFELEPAIVPPKIAPVADFDGVVALQPVAALTEPTTTATETDEDEESSKPAAKKGEGGTSSALQFLGLCGIVIMGMSALVGLLNIAGAIYLVTRPNVSISSSIVILGIVAFQSLIYFVLFRLGQGLLRCERASVQGLVVLYVIGVVAAACGMAAGYFLAGAIVMAALTVFMLPPIIVGFMAWSDLYGEDN